MINTPHGRPLRRCLRCQGLWTTLFSAGEVQGCEMRSHLRTWMPNHCLRLSEKSKFNRCRIMRPFHADQYLAMCIVNAQRRDHFETISGWVLSRSIPSKNFSRIRAFGREVNLRVSVNKQSGDQELRKPFRTTREVYCSCRPLYNGWNALPIQKECVPL